MASLQAFSPTLDSGSQVAALVDSGYSGWHFVDPVVVVVAVVAAFAGVASAVVAFEVVAVDDDVVAVEAGVDVVVAVVELNSQTDHQSLPADYYC